MFGRGTLVQLQVKLVLKLVRTYSQLGPNYYDVIISGGGMVGQTMACALSKNPIFRNLSILLIESSPNKDYRTPISYSNRVSSIIPSTKDLFTKLGIWKNISRYQEVKDMKVWGSFSSDYVHFVHESEKPSYIIENDEIINSAILENSSCSNLEILYGKTVQNVVLKNYINTKLHEIELDDKRIFKTTLLIGADGANSLIRRTMETHYISWKYNQFGVVATLNLADDEDNSTAWQRFLPDGPIAILPLKKGQSSLVWSVTEKMSKDLLQLPDEVFVDAVNKALNSPPENNKLVKTVSECSKSFLSLLSVKNHVLPLTAPYIGSVLHGSRARFPLGFGHSSEYVKSGVALIGDSAHRVHPLAGQGVNIGFRDIQSLEKNLSRGLLDGRELGHKLDLKHYETEAQRHNIPIMAATDMFHRIYTSKSDLMRAFSNSCIHIVDSISPIKNAMKHIATN